MIRLYTLKHRDADCGVLTIDTDDGKLQSYASYGNCQGPFLGNSTLKNMKRWWTARCVPADRKAMQEVIRLSGCFTSGEYLAKNPIIMRHPMTQTLHSADKWKNTGIC